MSPRDTSSSIVSSDSTHLQVYRNSMPNPRFRSVTVFKPSADTVLGITFQKRKCSSPEEEIMSISRLREGCLLATSPLQVGDTLRAINGSACPKGWLPQNPSLLLRELHGEVSILVEASPDDRNADPHLLQVMVSKPNPGERVGIGFNKSGSKLIVRDILPGGLLARQHTHLGLKPGDEILFINNVCCEGVDAAAAAAEIQKSPRELTFLARTPDARVPILEQQNEENVVSEPKVLASGYYDTEEVVLDKTPRYRSVSIIKPTRESLLGVTFRRDSEGSDIIISRLRTEEGVLLANSPLQVGDTLRGINGMWCPNHWTPKQPSLYLKDIVGDVSILVERTATGSTSSGGNPQVVQIMVTKPSPDSRVGISFVQDERRLVVHEVNPSGLLAQQHPQFCLQPGDEVLSINDISDFDGTSAASVIQSAEQEVTFLAKMPTARVPTLFEMAEEKEEKGNDSFLASAMDLAQSLYDGTACGYSPKP